MDPSSSFFFPSLLFSYNSGVKRVTDDFQDHHSINRQKTKQYVPADKNLSGFYQAFHSSSDSPAAMQVVPRALSYVNSI